MKIIKVYHLQFWYYLSFKVSSLEKLTSIFTSSSPTSLNTSSQTFHHPTYTTFLLYIFLIISPFYNLFLSSYLTSVFILPSNSATTSFAFSKLSFFPQESCSTINLFQHTKYFTTPLTFLSFNIFSTSHSLTLSISTSFASSVFYSPTCSQYLTTWLTFTTRWILIDIGSCNLTTLMKTTSSIIYGLTYQSTNFFAGHFLNTRSFILNITLSSIFHSSVSFLPLSTCHFTSCCAFLRATPAFFYTFFIFSANFVTFFTFSFLLISVSMLNL